MTDAPGRVIALDTVDSTNEEARRRIAAGEAGPLWIAARSQSAGRGRQGRIWASPPGNLFATHLFAFQGTPAEAARLSFAASVAVADVFAVLAPGAEVTLKWPNDVLINGRKASGLLLENFGPAADGALRLAIGIGLNLAWHPPPAEANWPPTSVVAETGETPDFDRTLALLTGRMDHWLGRARDEGFAAIRTAWLERCAHLGEPVTVRLPKATRTGRFRELDADGALVLEGPGGTERIAAGDVYFGD